MRITKSRRCSMIATFMSVLLIVTLMAGCRPSTPENPPIDTNSSVSDNGSSYEEIELFTTDGVTLRSRPLDWRSRGAENGELWRTLDAADAIDFNLYNALEYHGGYAYFASMDRKTIRHILQAGPPETVFTNDEPMGDWRVSLGAKYVAIYHQDGKHIDIWRVNPRMLVQTIEAQIGNTTMASTAVFDSFGVWNFWAADDANVSIFTAAVIHDNIGGDVLSFVQVHIDKNDAPTVSTVAITTGVHIPAGRFVFDPQNEVIAWDTMPMFFDVDTMRQFAKAGTHTNLYVYTVQTSTAHCVDERPVCDFLPRWVATGDLEINITTTTGDEKPGPFKGNYIVRKDILSAIDPQRLSFLYSIVDEQGRNKFYWGTIAIPSMDLWQNDIIVPAAQDRPVLVTRTSRRLPGALLFPREAPWFILFDARARGNMAITYDFDKNLVPASTSLTTLTYLNASQYLRDSSTAWKASNGAISLTRMAQKVTGSFDCGGGVHCIVATVGTTKRYWLLDMTDHVMYGCIDLVPGKSITSYAATGSSSTLTKVTDLNDENTGHGIDNLSLPMNMLFPTKRSWTAKPLVAAEHVIRGYFKYWNEKNVTEMEKRMTPDRKGMTWEFDKLEYVKLINIEEKRSSDENRKVFNVVFDIKFKSSAGSGLSDGRHLWHYLLKGDNVNLPWLIYDWGGGGYE